MKLVTLTFIALFMIGFCSAAERQTIIGASYLVYEGDSGVVGGNNVSFYSYNGDLLRTVEDDFSFPLMERMLDKNAPQPQPTSYKIRLLPAIQNALGQAGVKEGFIIFYDKNGNTIKSYQYTVGQKLTHFPLDTSIAQQIIK